MKPRLAVFELHHLGDAVLALPFLRGAMNRYEPLVVCHETVAEFLSRALPEVPSLPVSGFWPLALAEVRTRLRLNARDAAACVWADPRAHALMLASGAGVRAGFAVNARNFLAPSIPWRARRLAAGKLLVRGIEILTQRPLLTPPLEKAIPSQHQLSSWKQLADSLGFAPDDSLPWIAGTAHRQRARGDPPEFLLHPGGRLPTKRWDVERFNEVLRVFFAARNIPVKIVAVQGEPCPQPCAPGQTVVRTESFTEFIRLVSSVDAVLANDSFPAHLAAALGKPVAAIFGSGDPAWFSPFANRDHVISAAVCPHRPCVDRCLMPARICLEAVTVPSVCSVLERINSELSKR